MQPPNARGGAKRLAAMGAAVVVLFVWAATPCHAQRDGGYTTDKPSPLQLIKRKGDAGFPRFAGSVQISGRFAVERIEGAPGYLRVVFFPDRESAALLPRMTGERPVEQLLFSNWEQAASALLHSETTQTLLSNEPLRANGEATVTIRDYRIGAVCDRRYYEAELVSAPRKADLVVAAGAAGPAGCG